MDQYIAKTFTGLEQVLQEELKEIGAKEVKIVRRGVTFKADKKICYRANYQCRTAVRILKHISEFTIDNVNDLYEHIYALDWHKIMGVDATFIISAVAHNCEFINNSIFAAQKVKDAIVDKFMYMFNMRPNVEKESPDFRFEIMINGSRCLLMIDSSGDSLHLRGYRQATNRAPISEVLAAGLLKIAKWDGNRNLFDPMCGSGTILIEAAMIANKIPSGFFRKKWAFQKWHDYEKMIFAEIKNELNDEIIEGECEIIGSDIDPKSIEIAKQNINFAKLNFDIEISEADFFNRKAPNDFDFIITNPPYNKRIKIDDSNQMYENIGKTLKNNYQKADFWIITGNPKELKKIGLKSNEKRDVFNGAIECVYCNYPVF